MGLALEQQVVLEKLDIVITRFQLPKGANARNSLRKLTQQKTGATYDLNHYYQIAEAPQSSKIRDYPRRLIRWPARPDIHGNKARIGMVDTLVSTRIPALKSQRIITRSFTAGKKPSTAAHGTGIATIMVGASGSHFPGLIPTAKLVAANAFSIDKTGRPHASALAVAQALNWLVSQNVHVINASLTGPDNHLLKLAVERTLARHIPIVAAAGNNGSDAPPVFPAAYKNVIAVTAVDRFRRLYNKANQGKYIQFAAPGIRIWVPDKAGRGCYRQGTSYAAAFGTAMAATLLTQPKMNGKVKPLVRLLRKNVVDLGPVGKDTLFGWGLICHPPHKDP
jgi:subtilisin family serine protease